MKPICLLLPLLLAACDRNSSQAIEAVPPPSEQAAGRLMNGAEEAAVDAQSRMEQDDRTARSTLNSQGERR